MPDANQDEQEQVTISLPAGMACQLRRTAAEEFRTLDQQIAYYVSRCLPGRADAGGSTPGAAGRPGESLPCALQDAYLRAGKPSVREITRRSGHSISHGTVSNILNGRTTPSWYHLETVVKAIGADIEHFRDLWIQDQARRLRQDPAAQHGHGK